MRRHDPEEFLNGQINVFFPSIRSKTKNLFSFAKVVMILFKSYVAYVIYVIWVKKSFFALSLVQIGKTFWAEYIGIDFFLVHVSVTTYE